MLVEEVRQDVCVLPAHEAESGFYREFLEKPQDFRLHVNAPKSVRSQLQFYQMANFRENFNRWLYTGGFIPVYAGLLPFGSRMVEGDMGVVCPPWESQTEFYARNGSKLRSVFCDNLDYFMPVAVIDPFLSKFLGN